MISIYGKIFNINETTICRVILPPSYVSKNNTDYIFVNDLSEINENHSGGIITTSKDHIKNNITTPIYQIETENLEIVEGDILLIEHSGNAIKLYDSLSESNSLFLTEECNSRCIMCPQPPKTKDEADLINIALSSIELMSQNTKCLGITGGEPTLKWVGLIKVIEKCIKFLPNTQMQLLTNARILKDYLKAQELSEMGGKNLFVGVPLYSDTDQTHDYLCGSKGAFWDTLEGLYNLERAGIFIELRIVITKENYLRLPELAHFIYRTIPFVGCVVFMGMEPIGIALKNIDKLWIDPIDYVSQLERAIKILWQRNIRTSIFNHQLCTLPKKIWPLTKKSISEWKIIYKNECDECTEKNNCGGFFFSSKQFMSRAISAIH